MPSGKFANIPIDQIIILRESRQRRELKNIEDLATSIAARGLINPIVVTDELELVAGERRLTACRSLGWTHIPAQYASDLPPVELRLIELEENIRREDIDWHDQCAAVAEIHNLLRKTNETWTQRATAEHLNLSEASITRFLMLDEEIKSGNEAVVAAPVLSTAANIAFRKRARATANLIEQIVEPEKPTVPLLHANFYEWIDSYTGPPFNFIHADPPYGVNLHRGAGMNKANPERYDDSPQRFYDFIEAIPRIPIASQCHLMLWFSMTFYPYTRLKLHEQGWVVLPFPLIWGKSDNLGIMPDPKREGRRNYETAFVGIKGDRNLVQPVSNIWYGPRGEDLHPSVKPRPMLSHFFRMFVDSSTVMLDPMAGSGNAVRVAKDAGAASVLGLERDEAWHRDSITYWSQ